MKSIVALLSALAGLIAASAGPARSEAGPSPRMLVEIVDFAGLSISPDGTLVAFRREQASIERNAYPTAWYVQNLRQPGTTLRMADGGDTIRDIAGLSVPEQPLWSADSRWIYFRRLMDGEVQVWRAAVDGSRAEPVTQDAANVRRYVLAREGQALIYEVGASRSAIQAAEMAEYDNGILFDGTIHGGQNLFRSFPIEGRLASHRTSARTSLLADTPKLYRIVDLAALTTAEATEDDIAEFERQTTPGAVADAFRECGPCRSLTVDGFAWRNDDEVVFTARDAPRTVVQSLYAWRPSSNTLRQVAKSDGLINGDRALAGSTCAVGSEFAACVVASAGVPPRLERVDLDTGERVVLDDPNASLAAVGNAATNVELLRWSDASGVEFTGFLFTPKGLEPGRRLPLFLTYYICPGYLRGGYGDEWPLLSLAGAGVAALCINSAPITAYAIDDYNTGLGAVSSVISLLDDRGLIDRSRVGMGGLSFGSEVTTWVATRSNLLTAASIANSQPSPAGYWARALMPGWADAVRRRWRYGSPEETPAEWEVVSATYRVKDFSAPYLMQLPEGEYRGNIELYGRLVEAGKHVEMWVYPNETHQKAEPRHKLSVYERNLDWFRFWLQGYMDASLEKRTQYARWLLMRDERIDTH